MEHEARRRRLFMPLVLLAGLAFAAYGPSLSGDFLLDDPDYILANDILARPSLWPRFLYDPSALTSDRTQAAMMYRPLTALSFGVNRVLGGLNPYWYHLASVALHSLNTCLVFLLVLALFGAWPRGMGGGRAPPEMADMAAAAAGALLFCLHPAQAEGVAYISGSRAGLLSTALCLAAFLLHLRGRRVLAAAGFGLALLSKESAAFLLPVLAANDALSTPRLGRDAAAASSRSSGSAGAARGRRASLRSLPWRDWAAYAAILAGYLLARRLVLGRWAQREPWGEGWAGHLGMAVHGLFQDALNAAWPAALRACYSFREGPGFAAESVAMAAALACLAGLAAWLLYRRRLEGLGLAWFLLGLAPVSNVVPVDALAADRFLYAPLAGLGLALAGLLRKLGPGRLAAAVRAPDGGPAPARKSGGAGRALVWTGTACLLLGLGARSIEQQAAWQDGFSLDLAAHAAAPGDPCASVNLASHYYNWDFLGRAEDLASKALAPGVQAHVRRTGLMTLALVRMRAGRYGEALGYLDQAPPGGPRQGELSRLRAVCLDRMRRQGRGRSRPPGMVGTAAP